MYSEAPFLGFKIHTEGSYAHRQHGDVWRSWLCLVVAEEWQ